jgi:hypothetical protein
VAKKDLSFTTPARELGKTTPFDLDGETLYAVQPKVAALMAMVQDIDTDDLSGQAAIIDDFIDVCMTEETAQRLHERLNDPQDPFDLDTLGKIISGLQGVWTQRPPTSRPASSRQAGRTGPESTVRSRRVG